MPHPDPALASTEPRGVWLRIFGTPAAGREGESGHGLERKDAGWLAMLALGGARPRDELAAWLWPEVSRTTAAGSLRQRIFRLRRRLGHPLVQAAERVELLPDVRVLVDDGAPLLSGCDFPDCPEAAEWLRGQREQRVALRAQSLEAERARFEEAGELDAALAVAQQRLSLELLSEHALRQVMRLHYLRGDRASALAVFERAERMLKDELGARPCAETLALLATVEAAASGGTVVPAHRSATPACLQRPARLIGREADIIDLESAWAAGRVFLLLGEAGMGKTRLMQELAQRRPAATLYVAARPGDAGVPFGLLVRLLRAARERSSARADGATRRELARLLPELDTAESGATEGQGSSLQRAVSWQLGALADGGCPAILLDDLHFSDLASLEMLQALMNADAASQLDWGLAQRPAEGDAGSLCAALAESQRLHQHTLAPLNESAMRELVNSLGLPELNADALAAPLVRHTGGNPLFALETLKDLVLRGAGANELPQPSTVGALIERRLRALTAPALQLARVAAIAGADFNIGLAESVLGRRALDLADAWAELQAAHVLAGTTFAHDLVFDAVLRTVPHAIAAHVHGSVADWLRLQGAEAARVAVHFEAAERWPQAAEQFEAASAAARVAGRVGEAQALIERAVEAWKRAGEAHRLWRAELVAAELQVANHGPGGVEPRVERLLAEAADVSQRAAALNTLSHVQLFGQRWPELLATTAAALEAAGRLPEPGPLFQATCMRAQALSNLGRVGEAVELVSAMRERVDVEGSLRQRLDHRAALSYALNLAGRPQRTIEALHEVLELAEQVGDELEQLSTLSNLAVCELMTGYAAAAYRHGVAALQLRERTTPAGGLHALVAEMNVGFAALLNGRLAEALHRLEAVVPRLQPAGAPWVATAQGALATVWLHLGQPHRAEAALAAAPAVTAPGVLRRTAVLRARVARQAGRPDPALLEHLAGAPEGIAPQKVDHAILIELSRAVEPQRALALVRHVRREASASGIAGWALHALMREVDLLVDIDPGHARTLAAELAAHDAAVSATDAYGPELPWTLARAAAAAGDVAAHRHWILRAQAGIDAMVADLPAGLRSPFLERNRTNVQVAQALRALRVTGG